jgi:glycosyltransferase involved in cell wall biosynthesis
MIRPNGISVLIAAQNASPTVSASIASFARLADEIIVTENGSHDLTHEIAADAVERLPIPASFVRMPEARDLVEVRQRALEISRFRWVVRADADHVAYTSGSHDIAVLLASLLAYRPVLPVYFDVVQKNSYLAPGLEGTSRAARPQVEGLAHHVQPPTDVLQSRILHWWPGIAFRRRGRWESVRAHHLLRQSVPIGPYWRHYQIKPRAVDFLLRGHRTSWRGSDRYHKDDLTDFFRRQTGLTLDELDQSGEALTAIRTQIVPYLVGRSSVAISQDPSYSTQLAVPEWAAALELDIRSQIKPPSSLWGL